MVTVLFSTKHPILDFLRLVTTWVLGFILTCVLVIVLVVSHFVFSYNLIFSPFFLTILVFEFWNNLRFGVLSQFQFQFLLTKLWELVLLGLGKSQVLKTPIPNSKPPIGHFITNWWFPFLVLKYLLLITNFFIHIDLVHYCHYYYCKVANVSILLY